MPVRVTRAVALLVSVLVLTGSGYGWFAFHTLGSSITQLAGPPNGSGAAADPAMNILLVGDDHRPPNASRQELAQLSTTQDGGGTNTDTMMVLHIPAGGGKATVVSLPRDSWVDIPGVGKGKLNSAFATGAAHGAGDSGGMQRLIETVQNLTGLQIDHFVRISLLGFYNVAQVLGPVQVCLNQAVNDPYSGVRLPAGVSTLDAKQALSFVRQRHGLPRGDLDREVRQQYFLSVELQKITSAGVLLDPGKVHQLLQAAGSAVQTDSGFDLLQFATRFHDISPGSVSFTTIPVQGTPDVVDANGHRISVVAIDEAALPEFFGRITGRATPYDRATAAAPSSVTVRVMNGVGTPGLAAARSSALRHLGFRAVVDPTTTSSDRTTVTYPAGKEAQAKAVAQAVPGAGVAQSGDVSQVTLTLGGDGLGVPTSTGSAAAPSWPPSSSPAPSSGSPAESFNGTSCVN